MDLALLKIEISKPKYAGMNDEQISKELGKPSVNVSRETLSGNDLLGVVMGAFTKAEFGVWHTAMPLADKQYFQFLTTVQSLPFSANIRNGLRDLFPSGNPVRIPFLAYMQRKGTVAEEAGLGAVPNPSEVAEARRLT